MLVPFFFTRCSLPADWLRERGLLKKKRSSRNGDMVGFPTSSPRSASFCCVIINRWHNTDLAVASARKTRALARLPAPASSPPRADATDVRPGQSSAPRLVKGVCCVVTGAVVPAISHPSTSLFVGSQAVAAICKFA